MAALGSHEESELLISLDLITKMAAMVAILKLFSWHILPNCKFD